MIFFKKISILFFVFFHFFGISSDANFKLIKKYEQKLEEYQKQLCPSIQNTEFKDLLKNYRALGFSVPNLKDGTLNKVALKENILLLEKKSQWIEGLHRKLTTNKLRKLKEKIILFENYLSSQQVLQKRALIMGRALPGWNKKELNRLWKDVIQFADFLLGFEFPQDHLKNRRKYDDLKSKGQSEEASSFYLYRKAVEDGTYAVDQTKSDMLLRTSVSTIHLALASEDPIHYELISDLIWSLSQMKNMIQRGTTDWKGRLERWKSKTDANIRMALDLISGKKSLPDQMARQKLQKYVLNKHAEAYDFWSRTEPEFQKLWVADLILAHEIEPPNSTNEPARRGIAQVVLNRIHLNQYSVFSKLDPLLGYLKPENQKTAQKQNWLNLLYKQGEFSFTYYYMTAVGHMICPLSYDDLRKNRLENLKIFLDQEENPWADFHATRYISRQSMIGRTSFGSAWNDHEEYDGFLTNIDKSFHFQTFKGERNLKHVRFIYRKKIKNEDWDYVIWRNQKFWIKTLGQPSEARVFSDPDAFTFFSPKN